MRTEFIVKYPVNMVRSRYGELNMSLDRAKMLKIYPFLKDANCSLTLFRRLVIDKVDKVNKTSNKGKTKAEQKEIFEKLLNSREVKNQSDLARRFDVSRAWVSIVLNS